MPEKGNSVAEKECAQWLAEALEVFPKLGGINITVKYSEFTDNSLSCMHTTSEKDLDFDPEALLTGKQTKVIEKTILPENYHIRINHKLRRIRTPALRKQLVQHSLMHHLLTIEENLENIEQNAGQTKKIVTSGKRFQQKLFEKYNKLREVKGIAKIEKREHLDTAIHRILHTINWWQ